MCEFHDAKIQSGLSDLGANNVLMLRLVRSQSLMNRHTCQKDGPVLCPWYSTAPGIAVNSKP